VIGIAFCRSNYELKQTYIEFDMMAYSVFYECVVIFLCSIVLNRLLSACLFVVSSILSNEPFYIRLIQIFVKNNFDCGKEESLRMFFVVF